MSLWRLCWVLGVAVLSVGTCDAQDAGQLAQTKGCMICHDVSQAKEAPSFSDIAAQYKGQANAAAKLADELKNGTSHLKIPASDAELQQLIAYVLATP